MRMSCNGCRILRKGCAEDCSLRPCLQWIKSSESQANATLFLAKFYGRAGLINLINAGPTHLHSEIFRSLLYEACGRIIDPVHGSLGLMCSGNWPRCQAAVESVLQGAPLMMKVPGASDGEESASAAEPIFPLRGCDIRHLSKDSSSSAAASLHRVRSRNRFKRSAASKSQLNSFTAAEFMGESEEEEKFTITGWECREQELLDMKNFSYEEMKRAHSHDSSVETVEPTLANRVEQPVRLVKPEPSQPCELGLELTLGINPVHQAYISTVIEISDSES
ncbi:hypothetical protein MIMGU_mgv1a022644mg [Erythranthe guttata]|uniref:LOB domain-containing protein n=1 Tax=Erythranthe guttata TaxID=4155 RepID=A0A022REY6_ERYGU|nr:PREDICTED: LOB domain-containing protein 40-like [Erythranthe guttata]EYU38927.1 hypothetical protein MIMGU_mgv1a022644mg [Erythranthe guttata]|eukprot:XP_012835583.1 PREDICTED: LOB domain-containing protein 40-like [Erythranthe guttata]